MLKNPKELENTEKKDYKKARKTVTCPKCGYTFTAESPYRAHPPSEGTAAFIRAELRKNGKDHPYHLYKLWIEHLARLGMRPPKLSSFLKFFYCLRRAGLVRRTSSPTNPTIAKRASPFKKRNYFELVPNKPADQERVDQAWSNPQVAVYGERMRLGRKQYRKKVLHLPVEPRKRGRPRTRWTAPTA